MPISYKWHRVYFLIYPTACRFYGRQMVPTVSAPCQAPPCQASPGLARPRQVEPGRASPRYKFQSTWDYIQTGLEGIVAFMMVWHLIQELVEMYTYGLIHSATNGTIGVVPLACHAGQTTRTRIRIMAVRILTHS